MSEIYWVKKPWSVLFKRPCTSENVYTNGRECEPDVEYSDVVFTKHGVVHVGGIPHNDKVYGKHGAKELEFFTHYSMIHNGRLWRALSWGGTFDRSSVSYRTNKFARDVMRLSPNNNEGEPVPPSKEAEIEIERLRDTLKGLVDYVLSLVDVALPRIGIVFSSQKDYPMALRRAISLIKGGEGE